MFVCACVCTRTCAFLVEDSILNVPQRRALWDLKVSAPLVSGPGPQEALSRRVGSFHAMVEPRDVWALVPEHLAAGGGFSPRSLSWEGPSDD